MARILVVEDEPDIALALKEDLTLEGYEVEVVADGETAIRQAVSHAFTLILLDMMLPRKDGLEVCRELRRSGVSTPIILLTARSEEADRVLGLEMGADDYVTKPYSPRELRARIRAVLRRSAGEGPDLYSFGELEVDFTRQELRQAGQPVELTPLEFKLLREFIRRRGRALTRDQLLDQIWGPETFLTDRVIDNHIVNLRKKIEPDPAEPRYLVSVRGLGYRFDG